MNKEIVKFIKRNINKIYKNLKVNLENLEELFFSIKLASITTIIIIFAMIGTYINTGLGKIVDCSLLILIGVFVLLLSRLLLKFLLKILIHLPKKTTTILLATIIVLTIAIENSLYLELWQAIISAILIVMIEVTLAISIEKISQKSVNKFKVVSLLFITISVNLCWGIWAFTNLEFSFKTRNEVNYNDKVQTVFNSDFSLDNPLTLGKYTVESLTYGSGEDKRAEFGKEAKLTAGTVNVTPMLGKIPGFKGKLRELFWGFSESEYPLNGTVWYPKEKGKYPLVMMVHGNHAMEDYSDKGYAYLGELLASQGFITVSVDENFLNGSWSGDMGNENDVRAWILLKHLEVMQRWNKSVNNVFYEKVDMENIALVGHSRGGEAVATATVFNKLTYYPNDADINFNFHFNIKAVVAIAPTDGQYKPGGKLTPLENINYLVLQGSQDSDISSFYGDLQYNRVKFTDGKYYFKTSLYIEGANHGQFNSSWGNKDLSGPSGIFLNTRPMLAADKQREIAKLYISAFLQNTLYSKAEYIHMFQNYNYMQKVLPETKYINRFEDSNYRVIANYEEDVDLATGTLSGTMLRGDGLNLWREKAMMLRSQKEKNNNAVVLKWKNVDDHGKRLGKSNPTYSVKLSSNLALKEFNDKTILSFSMADTGSTGLSYEDKENIDLTIEVKDKNGLSAEICLNEVGNLNPAIKVKFTKWSFLEEKYDNPVEINLQSFQIPLDKLIAKNSKIKPMNIEYINFIFNKTSKGEILLDDIGFSNPHL
jgi:dienelactone hydrolase